jgi:hypothetical protein
VLLSIAEAESSCFTSCLTIVFLFSIPVLAQGIDLNTTNKTTNTLTMTPLSKVMCLLTCLIDRMSVARREMSRRESRKMLLRVSILYAMTTTAAMPQNKKSVTNNNKARCNQQHHAQA